MNVHELWIVVSKEIGDALRDRRSVMAGLLFALLGPMVLAAALDAMIASERNDDNRPVPMIGAARAPGLAAYLRENGVALEAGDGLEQARGAVLLAVPADAPRELGRDGTAMLELRADLSDPEARRQAQRIQDLVAGYGTQLAEQRLLSAGVTPSAARPLAVDMHDLGTQGGKAGLVLGMLPVFWLLGVFVGGAHVALDTTGGERERRSLEALLAQPVAPAALFTGKWLATSLFGYATAAAALLLSVLVLARLPLHEIGIGFAPDAALLARLLLALLPLALLAGALQCAMALHARSHKEGQTYLNLLQLSPMVLVIDQVGGPSLPAGQILPMLAQHAHLTTLLAGDTLAPGPLAASAALCVGAAFLLAWAGSRRLGNERFVFGL